MAASLHRRLVLILLGLNLVAWLVSLALTAVFAQQMIVQQIDRQLGHYMDMAQYTMGTVLSDPETEAYFRQNAQRVTADSGVTRVRGDRNQGREQATNMWFGRSQVLVGENAPAFPAPVGEGIVQRALEEESGTSTWRIPYRRDQRHDIWVAVGVNMAFAPSMGTTTLLRVILPLLVILPVTVFILLWGVGRGLRPLDALAAKIAARKPSALEPIDTRGVPREIGPVVASLNGLLDRLQLALTSEQRFTANAAHELQTPLAAIKAEVQRCQRKVTDDESRYMLARIAARVTRAADTVTQLLTLARLDPEQEFLRESVLMNDLVIDLVAEEGHVAVDRQLEIQIDADVSVVVAGHREWLKILIRNLLNNAFKYALAPGVVQISLARTETGICLSIINESEAINEQQRARLVDRFYSLPGRKEGGVGLGLSIVSRVAKLHGAFLHLSPVRGHRGLRAEVIFPA